MNPNYREGREKVESIEQIIYQINRYIRSPEELNDQFSDYIYTAVSLVLQHPIINGQKGDELASDFIFRAAKLFMNYCEKEKYLEKKDNVRNNLFKIIRLIFDKF